MKNLHVSYTSGDENIYAVNGVSFNLKKGESLGLVGETGAGKTTIAKSIMRILPEPQAKIDEGEIIFEGENLLTYSDKKMRDICGKKISMIFQDPMTALNPSMTIGAQVAEVVSLHSDVSAAEAQEQAVKMLEQVGIMADRYNNYPFQLSGGQRQRVVIAMAMVFTPELLLADEPTSALDVTIQAQILELMRSFREKSEAAVILITHDLGVVAENCDSVAVIYAGQLVEYGSLEDLFDRPAHPYTIGLFHSLPSFAKGEKRLHPILGSLPDPRIITMGCPFKPRCPHATEACEDSEIPEMELSATHMCRCLYPEV